VNVFFIYKNKRNVAKMLEQCHMDSIL